MKINEIIQRVQSLYSKGVQSDDSRLSPRHIYNKLLTLRSKYIAAQAKKKQKLNQWNFQRLSCVELEKVNPSMCPCQPVPGCDILRTKYPLPKPLSDLNSHLLQSVTSLDGSVVFSEIQWTEVKYKASNKYTSKKPDYFIDGGHLYLIGVTQTMRHLKMLTVVGLFEDPVEVGKMNQYCGEQYEDNCVSPLDTDFAVDNEFIDYMLSEASEELVTFFGGQKEDLTNDAKDNIVEESK